MVKIYKHGTSYVLDNKDTDVDIELLSKVLNVFLKDLGEIKDSDKMTRCIEHNHFIVLGAYGLLHGKTFYDFIRNYLTAIDCEFEFQGHFIANDEEFKYDSCLPDHIYKILKDKLSRISTYRGDQCGGAIKDTIGLDEGVKPLCEALNSFPFVKTFSSCEGHNVNRDSSMMYVLFVIHGQKRFDNLDKLVSIIDSAFEETWKKFDLKDVYIHPRFYFNKGHWPSVNGIYFEIRIEYGIKAKELLFEVIKHISKLIKGEEL